MTAMSVFDDNLPPGDEPMPNSLAYDNVTEFSVAEITQAIRRTIEGRFDHVRIRGEISELKRAASGHIYLKLKDDKAAIKVVCWKGIAERLGLALEDGMEVIATGRVTTYGSEYQLVIERVELAGRGALLKMLEERKAKLAAEGLFDSARKKKLPQLPDVIGVITSPAGAVIKDILHRLADRFPRRVLLWPVLVQGAGAAEQIAAAIRGMNALPSGAIPRPDIIIVARGGGSLEDLMAFNEEIVVRAAAESQLPLISAVGHETDTTLIDFAADMRAPTPTAAAEIAVPVRTTLITGLQDLRRRLDKSILNYIAVQKLTIDGLARGLPDPDRLLQDALQSLDQWSERWGNAGSAYLKNCRGKIAIIAARLRTPGEIIALKRSGLSNAWEKFSAAIRIDLSRRQGTLNLIAASFKSRLIGEFIEKRRISLCNLSSLLDSYSYAKVLRRGFALIRRPDNEPVTSARAVLPNERLFVEFHDGRVAVEAREKEGK